MFRVLFFLLGVTLCVAQRQHALAWPPAWNATITVSMGEVMNATGSVFYDAGRQIQVVYFEKCAVNGGIVNNLPCIHVESSIPDNYGVSGPPSSEWRQSGSH